MNKIKKLLLGFGLMALTMPAAAIERDADGYYLIGSTADYEEFCNLDNPDHSSIGVFFYIGAASGAFHDMLNK